MRFRLQGYSIILWFLIMVAGSPAIVLAQDAVIGSGPQLVTEEEAFNFGEVKEDGVFEHTFKIMNKGDQPLEIKDVKTT